MRIKTYTFITALFLIPFLSSAQLDPSQQLKQVGSIDGIVKTLYKVVSGDKKEERNWELFNYLFFKDAKLITTQEDMEGNGMVLYMKTKQYIINSSFYFSQYNFYEKEIHRRVDRFGNIAHVFSTYETYDNKDFKKPLGRGINSIQLYYDGLRWWIVNIYWTTETAENPIPEKYLPQK